MYFCKLLSINEINSYNTLYWGGAAWPWGGEVVHCAHGYGFVKGTNVARRRVGYMSNNGRLFRWERATLWGVY